MHKQRGSTTIVALIITAVVAAVVITSYISAANYGNRMEMQLKAKWEDNENLLTQYSQKIMEMGAVDVKSVTTAAIQGRYGEKGSQVVLQQIKEQNPTIDNSRYIKIQQTIEAGRNEFKHSQTQLIEIRRSYETSLGTVWQGFWLARAGYPKVDLSKYKIITTDRVSAVFQSNKEDIHTAAAQVNAEPKLLEQSTKTAMQTPQPQVSPQPTPTPQPPVIQAPQPTPELESELESELDQELESELESEPPTSQKQQGMSPAATWFVHRLLFFGFP